ncbi:unnamed protein product [Prorocentrum cordatum]|uniref:Uncharacterized protein n=1 Tax=Prorocentrum cordatum TaxID=2364126 RepID=A0ABN9V3L4_9DINO|nr:unnamed protein product [Polarella glacialis]
MHEFLIAARLRDGAPVYVTPGACSRCGADRGIDGARAACCAPGESTRGHNRVRDELLALASLSDGAARSEAPGLIEAAPLLRPADVLTTAAFGRLTALDVGIVAPHAAGAGEDAAAAYVVSKVGKYAPHLPALAADGIAYRPLVWTTWGRPREDASAAVASMAAAAGRRLGAPSHALAARARTAIGAAIWRRAARMVGACGPRLARGDVGALLPGAGAAGAGGKALAGALAGVAGEADAVAGPVGTGGPAGPAGQVGAAFLGVGAAAGVAELAAAFESIAGAVGPGGAGAPGPGDAGGAAAEAAGAAGCSAAAGAAGEPAGGGARGPAWFAGLRLARGRGPPA